ncbi:MAG: hypothetical protein JRI22_02630, partial [Deltaproteobacteria bacterium]|nr:hypothetical protein [Deltaproteobacteria bacterium]
MVLFFALIVAGYAILSSCDLNKLKPHIAQAVRRLVMIEPDILVETDNSGKSNLRFETAKKAEPVQPREKSPSKSKTTLPALTFNKVRIEN